ncbi:MAG: DUF349 domain-containing protein [Pseudomonadota bacterium]
MSTLKSPDTSSLDQLTGGAFSAPTSGERASRVRDWLATQPSLEQMQEVFRELSARDKGAARPLREKLDELKRAKGQEAIAAEWAEKARALLAQSKLNIADALAWQRDAAKAGAPLSREPLAALKAELAERVKGIEDLQHRVQVQREAAVLLAQRIEVLSTKSWKEAQAAAEALGTDIGEWQAQAQALTDDGNWASVDTKFPPLLEASRSQLQVVWDAFQSAVAQAAAAADSAEAPLPPVPVWADELRQARGVAVEPAAPKPAKPRIAPELREKATQAVTEALAKLEQEVGQGHGKASAGAANALRNALKDHGRLIDDKLENQAHAAIAAATELEGWQRWRADQLRQELVAQAEALFEAVPVGGKGRGRVAEEAEAAAPAAETANTAGEAPAGEAPAAEAAGTGSPVEQAPPAAADDQAEAGTATAAPAAAAAPEEVAAADATGAVAPAPDASVAETPAVEAPAAEAPAVGAPATRPPRKSGRRQQAAPAADVVLKPRYGGRKMQETLRNLREQWKQVDQGGPPNHALWKRFDEACNRAYEVVQAWLDKVKAEAAENRGKRLALIEEVNAWAQAHAEPADGDWKAVNRALHQFSDRWRDAGHLSEKAFAELQPQWKKAMDAAGAPLAAAQKASIDRRNAMIEEAKVLGAAPQLRIDAVKALQQRWQVEAQSAPLDRKHEQKLWDAFRKPIDDAFQRKTVEREKAASSLSEHDRAVLDASKALDAATSSGDAQKIRAALAALEQATRAAPAAAGKPQPAVGQAPAAPAPAAEGDDSAAQGAEGATEDASGATAEAPAPAAPPKAPPKPVIAARRGDDRPGGQRAEPAGAQRGGRFGDRKGAPGGGGRFGDRGGDRGGFGDRGAGRFGDREERGPRLGDAAFRAQRDALEHAQAALRKLAAQAHGEALTQLLGAWEHRSADDVPSVQELGRAVPATVRAAWVHAVGKPAAGDAGDALLRLEIAAEVPTPAEQLSARRMLQLLLLTKRNDPSPAQTWGEDTARVLATGYDAQAARRLQNALKVLLKR